MKRNFLKKNGTMFLTACLLAVCVTHTVATTGFGATNVNHHCKA